MPVFKCFGLDEGELTDRTPRVFVQPSVQAYFVETWPACVVALQVLILLYAIRDQKRANTALLLKIWHIFEVKIGVKKMCRKKYIENINEKWRFLFAFRNFLYFEKRNSQILNKNSKSSEITNILKAYRSVSFELRF